MCFKYEDLRVSSLPLRNDVVWLGLATGEKGGRASCFWASPNSGSMGFSLGVWLNEYFGLLYQTFAACEGEPISNPWTPSGSKPPEGCSGPLETRRGFGGSEPSL